MMMFFVLLICASFVCPPCSRAMEYEVNEKSGALTLWMEDSEEEVYDGYAQVKDVEIVDWVTVSRTTPVCNMAAGCLVFHYDTCNQVGTKYVIKYLDIEWNGKKKTIELERTAVKGTDGILKRSILCEGGYPNNIWDFSTQDN